MVRGYLSEGRKQYDQAHRIGPQDSVSQLGYYMSNSSNSVGSGASSFVSYSSSTRSIAPAMRKNGKQQNQWQHEDKVQKDNSRDSLVSSNNNSNNSHSQSAHHLPAQLRSRKVVRPKHMDGGDSNDGFLSSKRSSFSNEIPSDQSDFLFMASAPLGSVPLGEAIHRNRASFSSKYQYFDQRSKTETHSMSSSRNAHNRRRVSIKEQQQHQAQRTKEPGQLMIVDETAISGRPRQRRHNGEKHGRRMRPMSYDNNYLFNPYALSELFSQSEIPGFREIFASDSYLRKFCWIVAFLIMTVLSLNDLSVLITEYYEYPITVGLRLRDSPRLPFPSVTVCNLNVVRFSALCSSNVNSRYNLTNQIRSEIRDRLCKIQVDNRNKSSSTDISDINNIGLTSTTTTSTTTTTTSSSTTSTTSSTTSSPIRISSSTINTLIGILNQTSGSVTTGGPNGGVANQATKPPVLSDSGTSSLVTPTILTTTPPSTTTTITTTMRLANTKSPTKASGGLDLGLDFPIVSSNQRQNSQQANSLKKTPSNQHQQQRRRQASNNQTIRKNPIMNRDSLIKGPFSSRQVPIKIPESNNPQRVDQRVRGKLSASSALSRSPPNSDRRNVLPPGGMQTTNAPSATQNPYNNPGGGTINPTNNNQLANQLPTSGLPEDFEHNERMERELTQNLTDWLAVMYQRDPQLTMSLGHQFDDMLLRCTMKSNNCTHQRSFHTSFTPTEGNCFTYKSRMRKSTSLKWEHFDEVNLAGTNQGLELVLNLEKNEYTTGSSQVGALVMIHHPNDSGYAAGEAIFIAPEFTTYIGLKMVNITRLPHPHPENCVDSWPRRFADKMTQNSTYSQQACLKICLQKTIQSHCQCQSANLPILELDNSDGESSSGGQQKGNTEGSMSSSKQWSNGSSSHNINGHNSNNNNRIIICDTRKQLTRQCVSDVTTRAADRVQYCDCQPKCQVVRYDKTVSMARWPTWEDKVTFDRAKMDVNFKNLAKVIVYFQTMTCDEVTQQAVYNAAKLFSNIGGIMGMYVGFSFLSIFEIFEVVSRKTWHHFRAKYSNNQVVMTNNNG